MALMAAASECQLKQLLKLLLLDSLSRSVSPSLSLSLSDWLFSAS